MGRGESIPWIRTRVAPLYEPALEAYESLVAAAAPDSSSLVTASFYEASLGDILAALHSQADGAAGIGPEAPGFDGLVKVVQAGGLPVSQATIGSSFDFDDERTAAWFRGSGFKESVTEIRVLGTTFLLPQLNEWLEVSFSFENHKHEVLFAFDDLTLDIRDVLLLQPLRAVGDRIYRVSLALCACFLLWDLYEVIALIRRHASKHPRTPTWRLPMRPNQ